MRVGQSGAAALLVMAAFSSAPALAGGFGNRLQSTIGAGLAFAGGGTTTYGLSGMYWNPAAVNMVDVFETSSNFTFVAPYAKITAGAGTTPALLALGTSSGNVGIDALVPGSYYAYRINPQWAIGLAVTAPYGLATKANTPWAGQNLSITAKAQSIDVAAIIGYKINDWLSIAAGPRLVYAKARFSRDISPLPGVQAGTLQDLEDTGFGFTVGLTAKPWEGGEISLGYRSRVDLKLDGELGLPGGVTFPATGKVTLPDEATFAISQRLAERWTLLGSVEWKHWSLVQDVPFTGPPGPLAPTLTFRYKDGWNFALGAEYQWDDRLTLRGGASYEISPVDDQQRDTSIPDNDRIWLALGASYRVTDNVTVDFGYSHAFVRDGSIAVGPGTGHADSASLGGASFRGKVDGAIDVVSLGLRYRFGSPAVAVMPQAPVVAKY